MANMSYCIFQNTLSDLRDCYAALREGASPGDRSSEEEGRALLRLIRLCRDIGNDFGDLIA